MITCTAIEEVHCGLVKVCDEERCVQLHDRVHRSQRRVWATSKSMVGEEGSVHDGPVGSLTRKCWSKGKVYINNKSIR